MPLSDEVRRELAAIEPQRDCDRLAELSGLFHTAGSLHLRGPRRLLGPPRRRRVGGRPPRVRAAPARVRRRGRDPDVQAARLRRARPGTRSTCPAASGRSTCSSARASSRPRTRRSRRRRSGWSGRPAAGSAYLRGAFLGAGSVSGPALAAPRDPDREPRRARSCSRPSRRRRTSSLRVHDRGRHAAAYAKGAEPIADALALVGAGDAALSLDEHAVVAEARARANRVANADHANLVRTSRAAHAPDPRDPASSRPRGGSPGSRRRCARSPSCGSATPPLRCASSRRNAARRRRRRLHTGA